MKHFLVVIALFAVAIFAGCGGPTSTLYDADLIKTPGEAAEYLSLLNDQGEAIQAKIDALNSRNEELSEANQNVIASATDEIVGRLAQRAESRLLKIEELRDSVISFETTKYDLFVALDTLQADTTRDHRSDSLRLMGDIKYYDSLSIDSQRQWERLVRDSVITWSHSDSVMFLAKTGQRQATINRNCAVIAEYQKQLTDLQGQTNDFVVRAATKERTTILNVHSDNVTKFADAVVKINGTGGQANVPSTTSADTEDAEEVAYRGIIINDWHRSVTVTVTGPDFLRSFDLAPHSRKVVDLLPRDTVQYTVTFLSGRERKSIIVWARPNNSYEERGVQYALRAVLPEK